MERQKWGFLRETTKQVEQAKQQSGGHYETLDDYLKVIFPAVADWVKNKGCGIKLPNGKSSIRPDYRSESLKLIIEIDGLPHYKNPLKIIEDEEKDKLYLLHGYKVVRIPYFIQLTNEVVVQMFGVEVKEELFDRTLASFVDPISCPEFQNTPAFLCPLGIKRMAGVFVKYPQQYQVNREALALMSPELSGLEELEREYSLL